MTLSTTTSDEPSHHDVEMALWQMEIQAIEGEPFLGSLPESPHGRVGEGDGLEAQFLQATSSQTTSTTDVMAAHNMALAHEGMKIGEPPMHGNNNCSVDALFSDATTANQKVRMLDDTALSDMTPTLDRVVAQQGMMIQQ
jgi:hypothetical protein